MCYIFSPQIPWLSSWNPLKKRAELFTMLGQVYSNVFASILILDSLRMQRILNVKVTKNFSCPSTPDLEGILSSSLFFTSYRWTSRIHKVHRRNTLLQLSPLPRCQTTSRHDVSSLSLSTSVAVLEQLLQRWKGTAPRGAASHLLHLIFASGLDSWWLSMLKCQQFSERAFLSLGVRKRE